MTKRGFTYEVPWLGLESDYGGPTAYFADDYGIGSESSLDCFREQLRDGDIPKPPLPTKFIRVSSRDGKPSVSFDETGEGRPAFASGRAARIRAASSQAPIEHWAMVALEKPSETELAIRAEFWKEAKEFYSKLQAMSPGQLSEFFAEQLSPLPVTIPLEAEKPKRKELDNASHLDWSI